MWEARTRVAMPLLLGGAGAGGAKIVVGVARGRTKSLRTERIPTREPEKTLREVIDLFRTAEIDLGALSATGVASFGPLGVNPSRSS
ncbi:hypothetical protein CKY28_12810 [Sphingomonas lenta]|uniref:Uncharacterized protein n=1 Tax=Sphingomonas lenta TaxID=1141887 RepID=A0A2A2SCB5_9SPHN|nr:hypothetical protein CKY28_12810 [Sphingomonas lenta]